MSCMCARQCARLPDMSCVQCDLKPENVLVGPAGLDGLKVTGNGLACVVDPNEGCCVSVPPIFHMARETLNRGIGDGNYDGKVPSDYDGKVPSPSTAIIRLLVWLFVTAV